MSANAASLVRRTVRLGSPFSWTVLELVTLFALLTIAVAMRIANPEGPRSSFPDLFDEGIRAEQLLLMSHGFRPFKEIYSSQGVLLLPLLYPFYVLFGETLGAIRLGVGLISIVGLVGAWWSVRQVAGGFGALSAVFLLVVSSSYLEASQLALAEVPSLVPCIWAIGCGLRWLRTGRSGWLYGAAALGVVGVLIKPMAIAIAVPLGFAMLLRPGLRRYQAAAAVGIAVTLAAAAVLAMGPHEVWQQIGEYRAGAAENTTFELRKNVKEVVTQPARGQPGLFVLGAASALLVTATGWRSGVVLVSWVLAVFFLLLGYASLHPKHLVYLYPPLALLGGAGLGRAARLAWRDASGFPAARLFTLVLAAILAAVTVGSGPARADDEHQDADLYVFDRDAQRSIQALTRPGDFIITDHPYVAALARRLVPPGLVDPSLGRIRAGVLQSSDVLEAAQQYDTRLVLIWADRLRRLSGVPPWLERDFVLSHSFGTRSVKNPRGAKDRSVYLRRDSDLAAAREALLGTLPVRETMDFEGKLRVIGMGASTELIAPDEPFTVTVGFEALAPMSVDYHVTLWLEDSTGHTWAQQEHDLEGSARGTSTWQPGRWLFKTFLFRPQAASPAGQYTVRLRVVDPKLGRELRVTPGPNLQHLRRSGVRTVVFDGLSIE